MTFEDETGLVEITFFPDACRRLRDCIVYGQPCLLTGRVERDWGALTLTVEEAVPLAGCLVQDLALPKREQMR